jgi:hypothetical protein
MEQALIVHLLLSGERIGTENAVIGLTQLQDEISTAIQAAGEGEFDGDEFGEGECVLFLYGPSSDRLFAVIEPILRSSSVASCGYAIKRYGEATDQNARMIRVTW